MNTNIDAEGSAVRGAASLPPAASAPALPGARIVVVDDEAANVRVLTRLLEREGYHAVEGLTDSERALRRLDDADADLVILDLHMPFPDGFALLEHIGHSTPPGTYLPVLVLTGDAAPEARNRALALGARDFLTKPFDALEARYRIRNLLHTRRLHLELEAEKVQLEARVRERTAELQAAHHEVLTRLTRAAALRDDVTGEHTLRVGALSARIAERMGLPPARVEVIREAAPLHDVGKIGIPDAILHKPGPLTAEERATMATHTTVGAAILAGGTSELMRLAERIALGHHERWEGGGYPLGVAGAEIPLAARIVAVADFFDAVTHDRPYREAWPRSRAMDAIREERGRQFDPEVVDAFLEMESDDDATG